MGLSAIYEAYSALWSFPPYHPAMMTALLLFGYCQGSYFSRRLETACVERVDFKFLAGREKPDHSRINESRRRHRNAMERLIVQVLRLCQDAGLTRKGHLALVGTRVKVGASKHSAIGFRRILDRKKERGQGCPKGSPRRRRNRSRRPPGSTRSRGSRRSPGVRPRATLTSNHQRVRWALTFCGGLPYFRSGQEMTSFRSASRSASLGADPTGGSDSP